MQLHLAPVSSLIFWMWMPALPMRNLWCCGLARISIVTPLSCFSSLISFSSLTAFSTSSVGPLTVTTSDPELGSGNLIFTYEED